MPRDSSGNYTLPAGNPVVTATVISSTWANNTLSDLGTAMTDSLSRSGQGGMTAPFQLTAGAVGAPSLTWTLETTSGFYRAGAGDFRFSVSAADKIQFTANGIRVVDGAVGTPGFSFILDTNTGIYRIGADNLGIATAGVLALSIDATQHCLFIDGTVGAPAISFAADTNTGIYRIGADDIGIATNGVLRFEVNANGNVFVKAATSGAPLTVTSLQNQLPVQFEGPNTGVGWNISFYDTTAAAFRGFIGLGTNTVTGAAVTDFIISPGASGSVIIGTANGGAIGTRFEPTGRIRTVDGSAGSASYSFEADPNTGLYRVGADDMSLVTGGVDAIRILSNQQASFSIGTAGNPSISFIGDTDTGFYRDTANQIGIALAGATAGQIAQGSFTGTLTGFAANPTGTVSYQRIGNSVRMWCNSSISGTSNATTMTMTGLPGIIQPSAAQTGLFAVTDNTVATSIANAVISGGTVTFFKYTSITAASASGFTNSGTKGLSGGWTMTYEIN